MSVTAVIEAVVGRWDIEFTFEEIREHLGLEMPCGRTQNTVRRVEPSLSLSYSPVVYWYTQIAHRLQEQKNSYSWHGKESKTYSNVIIAVRRSV
jgi:hypothetical protein